MRSRGTGFGDPSDLRWARDCGNLRQSQSITNDKEQSFMVRQTQISIRFPEEMLEEVDAYAEELSSQISGAISVSRAAAIRFMVEEHLKARRAKSPSKKGK